MTRERLDAIERGDEFATLLPETDWPDVTTPAWKLADGWAVAVFFDCGEWDYIDRVRDPNGHWRDVPSDDPIFWYRPVAGHRWPLPDSVCGFGVATPTPTEETPR